MESIRVNNILKAEIGLEKRILSHARIYMDYTPTPLKEAANLIKKFDDGLEVKSL